MPYENGGRKTSLKHALQRPVFNNIVFPSGYTWPPGVNLAPRGDNSEGECSPLRSPPGVNTLYWLEEWRGKLRISPPGDNFTARGQSTLLGDNFDPGGQSLPLGAKLTMGLRPPQMRHVSSLEALAHYPTFLLADTLYTIEPKIL
jgi:hypothetical protein